MNNEVAHIHEAERLYVLYGSETGNAESIAKRLHHDAITSHGFANAECMTLNEALTKKFFDTQFADDATLSICVVIVCSTTGDGEPPQNAARFCRWLRNTAGTLHNTRYCLLALGDTNYSNFCAPGIFIDKKLNDRAAVRCYPRGEADDGVGLHLVVNPWVEGLWAALKKGGMEGGAPAGLETHSTAQTRTGLSVSQGAAVLYSNASQLCATTALFLHERITEFGGNADLYPIQYFHPRVSLTRPPTVLLLILGTECDAGTRSQQRASAGKELPLLGAFSAWIGNGDPCAPPPAEAAELQRWMTESPIRFFEYLIISRYPDDARRAAALDADLKAIATNCKLELLPNRQLPGGVPSVAVRDEDVFLWLEKVLGSLPEVTAGAEDIHRSLQSFFDNRVGAAFRSALAPELLEGRDAESRAEAASVGAPAGAEQRYSNPDLEHGCDSGDTECKSARADEFHGDFASRETHQVLDDLLTPIVYLYSEETSFVKECAMDIFSGASQHHLRSSIEELSNFGRIGFPRHATLVFVISGALTISMAHVLSVLSTLQDQGQRLGDVSFAILSIGKASEHERLNACAEELEMLLFALKTNKICTTGLADVDRSNASPIIQSWKSTLWGAIVNVVKHAADLDAASHIIRAQRSGALPAVGSTPTDAALSLAGASVSESADCRDDGRVGDSSGSGLIETHVLSHRESPSAMSSLLPLPDGGLPSRTSGMVAPLAADSVIVKPVGDLGERKRTRLTSSLDAVTALEVVTTAKGTSMIPADAVLRNARSRPRHAALAYCGAPANAVLELAEYMVQAIRKSTSLAPMACTADDLITQKWRGESGLIFFIVGRSEDTERLLNGGALARVLWHHTAALDMFADVSYTVLAVSNSGVSDFRMGRQLDRRLEELGGTRVYPRGEVGGSSRLEKMATWSGGLLNLLKSTSENPFVDSDAGACALRGWPPENFDSTLRNAAAARDMSDSYSASSLLQRLCQSRDEATEDAGLGRVEPLASMSAELCEDTLDDTCGGSEHGVGDGLKEVEEDCEEAQSFPSTEAGSDITDNAGERVEGVVRAWILLTGPRVRHPVVQLDLSVSAGTQWVPGQTIAVFPSNSTAEVEALLRLFDLMPEEPFLPLTLSYPGASAFPAAPLYQAVEFPLSCEVLLLRYVELRVTACQKGLFELLERHCVSDEAKSAVQDMYAKLLTDRSPRKLRGVLEAVVAIADSLPPFRHVVENLALLRPRKYSICSAHRADPATLSICFKVVESGLCTEWMYEQCVSAAGLPLMFSARADPSPAEGKTAFSAVQHRVRSGVVTVALHRVVIPFVICKASAFRMPRDPHVPMILIGSGTGIAPFRAFLQEREAWLVEHRLQSDSRSLSGKPSGYFCEEATQHCHAVCGSIDVFFGCGHRHEDYLFGDELAEWKNKGVARSLTVAFSRDTNNCGGLRCPGCYVQEKVEECGAALVELMLKQNAHVFVCGDADGMAKGVHETLRKLIQQHLSLTDGEADRHLEQMRMNGTYLRDVWSTRMRK